MAIALRPHVCDVTSPYMHRPGTSTGTSGRKWIPESRRRRLDWGKDAPRQPLASKKERGMERVAPSCCWLFFAAGRHGTRVETYEFFAPLISSTKQTARFRQLHRVSKNVPPLACCNFDAHEWILIFFGRNVTDKVGNQNTFYHATSNNLCFCTTWQNAETRISHISLNWIVLHTQITCALSSWRKKLSFVMCLIASNICWDSKLSH